MTDSVSAHPPYRNLGTIRHIGTASKCRIRPRRVPALEDHIRLLRGVTLEEAGVAADVRELWMVANAVRDGDGPSLRNLVKIAPRLREHMQSADDSAVVANMRRFTRFGSKIGVARAT